MDGRENMKHDHQFVIPVEWETDNYSHVIVYFVTKLRCSCGEEVLRTKVN